MTPEREAYIREALFGDEADGVAYEDLLDWCRELLWELDALRATEGRSNAGRSTNRREGNRLAKSDTHSVVAVPRIVPHPFGRVDEPDRAVSLWDCAVAITIRSVLPW